MQQVEQVKKFGNDRVFRMPIVITLGHTNATGNVYFSNYFSFQGTCREHFLLNHVPNINQMFMQTGIRLVTIDAYTKYASNAYFGDTLIAEVTIKDVQASQAKMVFRFRNKDNGKLVAEGYQHICCVNRLGKVIKLPKIFEFMDFYNEV